MPHLEIGGQRHEIPPGDSIIGSGSAAQIELTGEGVAAQHAVVQGLPDGQVAIRLVHESAEVQVNGVKLGPQPTPLLHGDKVEIAGLELLFVDERRSGSTQYVQAVDPAMMAQAGKKAGRRAPTAGTGGRLVSLTDGREYAITGPSLLLGREAGCDVVITSKNVSRRHAEIMASPKGYVLVDSSTNGTFVNGQRVEGQHLLARGDVIQCGEYEFRFYADLAPEPAAEAPAPPQQPAAPQAPQQQAPPPPQAPQAPPPQQAPAAPQAPAAAPGAAQRLSDTLHGVPGAKPEGAPPAQPSAPPKGPVVPPPARRPAAGDAAAGGPPKQAAARPSGGTGVLASLIVRSGSMKGQRFPIRVPIVNVGRAEYNDIVLVDDSVSTTHAKLQRREGIWVLVDLESTNGTLVDGEPVQGEAPLAPGAFVRFGDVQTVFEPTDDTIDAPKGSSTRMISAFKMPPKPPDAS
jgi:pSer/pThr/pTyr-binding forkhead associated (FHA) protein